MNRYKAMQQNVQMSEELKARTLTAAREAQQEYRAPRRRKPRLVRAVAAVCALGILLAGGQWMAGKGNAADPVSALVNTFGLVAYAADTGEVLPAQDSKIVFDSGSGQASEEKGMYTGSLFRVTGDNIASVRLQMDKGGVYRSKRIVRNGLTAADTQALENGEMPGVDGADDCMISSPDEKTFYFDTVWQLGADVTEPYDADASYGFLIPAAQYQQLGTAVSEDLQAGWHDSIDFFNGATLTVTVTFTDGTSQSKNMHLKTGKLKAYWPVEGEGARALPELVESEDDPYLYGVYAEIE